ncbi:peptigoglycan-binding protein LysM [Stutzerimonas nosocomialis]|uniref:Peptigoglycan-binding protein LysM n=1 Tax=Stutzerimonas nosocomialis TaxID=1056496 RepID=A0A5R9QYR0_9GAMM|nr:peptigoglycan-binding protein LysM [Stutzerimonas nosocomialis]TLX63965.1 peptigoglycan-binding protein LysM [Stutzerimonas nosocomialis]
MDRRAPPARCRKRLGVDDVPERQLRHLSSQPFSSPTPASPVVCVLLLAALLTGCAASPSGGVQVVDRNARAPVTSGQYTVQRGDTLYAIAFRFGWDWKQLAQRNGIQPPYVIYPGQRIRFDGHSSAASVATAPPRRVTPAAPPPPATSSPVIVSTPASRPPVSTTPATQPVNKPATTPVTPVTRSASGWAWPANGPIIGVFSSNGSLNKGIDIAGELGQPVLAASDGTVVYAGSGLRGYGELVIIKHNDTYVSAYGHNRRLLVREGEQVKAGQTIAEMGSTGTDRVKLHFEIRRQGKPVDPQQYLPKR